MERCFGLLILRWAILRSPSLYLEKTQTRLAMAMCLLHNRTRREMAVDPLEEELDPQSIIQVDGGDQRAETSDQWTIWR